MKNKFVCCAVVCAALFGCTSSDINLARYNFGEYFPLEGTPMQEDIYTAENIHVERAEGRLLLSGGSVRIDYNLSDGHADFYRAGSDEPVLRGVFTETDIQGVNFSSTSMTRSSLYLEAIQDGFGAGVKVSVKNTGENLHLWQNFYLYSMQDYIILETVVESPSGTMTNYIAPIAAGTGENNEILSLEPAEDPRFLFVPWDNDGFIRYRSDRLIGASESYGVTAVFDNESRHGFVTGAVTHDTWKTGIRIRSGIGRGFSPIVDFRVFGGIATGVTRDIEPHGSLLGHQIYSPKIFFGFYDDWRDGMEEYGRANTVITPPLPWDQGTAFGWNSWSALAFDVTSGLFTGTSDHFKAELPWFSNNNGITYINLDSYWDSSLAPDRLREAVRHVNANGHKAGTYGGFYSYWDPENLEREVEGTDGRYRYSQVILRDRRGRPLPRIAGALSLDPTHPGTIMRAAAQIRDLIDQGFEYVKLDFMAHGAREGVFFNRAIRTGVQAYNYGMKHFIDGIRDELENQKILISLSIAPLFPSQYAHARRISCDIFGSIDNAEYLLNSLTYAWWQGGTIYAFNDPDHITLYNSYNHRDAHLFNEGLTSFISKAITGYVINSDDFRQPEARERARQILGNEEINRMAADGISFRPVEGNTGDRSADIFVRHDQENSYLAVFNFSRDRPKTMTVDFARAGLDPNRTWQVRDMIAQSDEAPVSGGSMTVTLDPAQPGLFRLY